MSGSLPATATDPRWVEVALGDLEAVLSDHLHCERKAAQSALSLVRSYPGRLDLVDAVTRLAHEETAHVLQVQKILAGRGSALRYDEGDDYAARLRRLIRRDEPGRLLDTLLVFALIEARSAERLSLLAAALGPREPALAETYRTLATAEVRHRDTFLELAAAGVRPADYRARLAALAAAEAELVAGLPIRARIH